MKEEALVGVVQDGTVIGYPEKPPFSPPTAFPEYPFGDALSPSAEDGRVYRLVRDLLQRMDLDAAHVDTPEWNPLGAMVRPGDTVVCKPNLVIHRHGYGWDIQSVITHGSVVRAVLDYVWIALRGEGKIIIGDAPLQSADFDRLIHLNGLDAVAGFYRSRGIDVDLIDFRQAQAGIAMDGILSRRRTIAGDPRGSTAVNLGRMSLLEPLSPDCARYRVTNYDPREMGKHHNRSDNEYLIANSILQADVVINLPKMKTHRKVGITSGLKNMVGVNGHKDWLPHHRQGSADEGGDEYLRADPFKAVLSRLFDRENAATGWAARRAWYYPRRAMGLIVRLAQRDRFFEGSWYGNDTAWRMVLDLNRIVAYADRNGAMREIPQRRIFTLVDGIIAGEGEGPLEPTPRPAGILIAGRQAAAVDAVIARLMGFDYRCFPLIREAFVPSHLPLVPCSPEEIRVASNDTRWDHLDLSGGAESLHFEPPSSWKGHVELARESLRA